MRAVLDLGRVARVLTRPVRALLIGGGPVIRPVALLDNRGLNKRVRDLDIGTGLPSANNTHEVAQSVDRAGEPRSLRGQQPFQVGLCTRLEPAKRLFRRSIPPATSGHVANP